ncbi:hypothetical protein [Streptomyces sp. NPDC088557]|uniref:hypothetical protein n=1 Tax=Streptomyces sp. NPDC088557 TaxID=3365867 RepID=UPI00382E77E7
MPDEDRTPQQFRELLRAGYDYPDDIENTPGRRRRRRARRAHRQAERARTTQWIAQERRREPIGARAALLVVAVLLGVGALARFGPAWITGGEPTAARPPAAPGAPAATGPGPDGKPPAPGTPTAPAPSADLSDPERVAEQFVRHYLTRNPPQDGDHTAAVRRAEPWATAALTENLAGNNDPAFDRLVSRGGVSAVTAVTVTPAGRQLPVDTPLRMWRTVKATVDVVGYTAYTETSTLQVELTTTGTGWQVSRLLGV